MKNIAPGVRRSFAAEKFPFIDGRLWKDAREEARDNEADTKFECFASDIDRSAVELTRKNAAIAGVSDIVTAFQSDCLNISSEGRRGTIVTNPPYGERLMTPAEAEALYKKMGEHFRSLAPWQVYHPSFEKFYGRRADKVRKLYNGMIPCYLYQFFKNK